MESERGREWRSFERWAAILTVVVLSATALGWIIERADGAPDLAARNANEHTPATPLKHANPSSTSSISSSTTTPAPPPSSGTLGPPTAGIQSEPVYLDWPLEAGHNDKNAYGGWDYETYSSNGVSYSHAAVMHSSCAIEGADGGDFWIDYDLSRDYRTFSTMVGLSDDSPADMAATYNVYVDGTSAASGSLTFGTARKLDIPVAGALRLRLFVNDSAAQCSNHDRVVWGSPMLTR